MDERRPPFGSSWAQVPLDSESLRIHARSSAGSDDLDPIVFVPGLGLSGRSMLPTAALLRSRRSVYVVDPPGTGRSARPAQRLDLRDQASLWAAWIAGRGHGRAVWVGHSFGSQVVAELATRHPEQVARLVLASPTVDARARTMLAQLKRIVFDAAREPPSLLRMILCEYASAGPTALLNTGRIALRDRMEAKLPAITTPTLVVYGDRDPLVPASWATCLTSLLPTGQLVVIPQAAHALFYAAAEVMAAAIDDFSEAAVPNPETIGR